MVICGPTGCGKSTTLYTTLELIKSPESKIYTVEDPIERKLQGVVQTEVKPAIGLDVRAALRTLLRATPTSSWSARSATWRPPRWPPTPP